jgi:hypothetical protein
MSGAADRRLDKIAGQLTPQQAVLLWMQDAHQYPTVPAYMDSLKDAPDTKYPMMWLPERVEQAVGTALKGEKPDLIKRAERKAVREVAFLFYLQMQVNTRLWGEWRALCFQLAYVALKLGGLCEEEDPSTEDVDEVRKHIVTLLREYCEWEVATRKIADRYYAGTSALFPRHAEQLARAVEDVERVAMLFNDDLDYRAWQRTEGAKGKQPKGRKVPPLAVEPIDIEEIRQATVPAGIELARHIVVMARAEAMEFLGETRQALEIVRAQL